MIQYFTSNKTLSLIILLVIWQYISILLTGMLGVSPNLVWVNFTLISVFIFLFGAYKGFLLLLLSIPFFLVLPGLPFDSLSMWRPLFVLLFMVWLIKEKKLQLKSVEFLPWDKYLLWFFLAAVFSVLAFAEYKIPGIKQLIFFLNIYLFYLVGSNVIKTKEQVSQTVKFTIWSLTIIVTLGFAQLIGTFLTNLDTFWVYWASNISQLYYGSYFSSVALYSNSWFSYVGGRNLRMFSIMPDSQSFAYVCMFGLCLGTALTREVFVHIRKWLWSGIRFAGMGVMLSGTRAVWAGAMLPVLAVAIAWLKDFMPALVKKFKWPFVILFLLLIISPLINKGLSTLRIGKFEENFLDRAKSIYDLKESSNAGRIEIWKSSLIYGTKHPWGIGLQNFLVAAADPESKISYEDLAGRVNEKYNLPARFVSAHSLFLQVFVETGFVGLGLFLLFFYKVLKTLFEFLKAHLKEKDFYIYLAAQFFLAALWVLAAGFFDITLFNDKVLMYFFINLLLSGVVVTNYKKLKSNA